MKNCTVNAECAADPTEEHVRALNTRAWDIRRSDTETARQMAQQSMELCRTHLSENPSSLFWKRESGRALLILAIVSARLCEYSAALEQVAEAITYFVEAGYKVGHLYALSTMAGSLSTLGECERALETAQEGVQLAAGLDEPEAASMIFNVKGMIHWTLADYPQALEWFLRSLATIQETDNRREKLDILNNVGMMYTSIGDFEKGFEYSNTALLLARDHDNKGAQAVALLNIGILHFQQENADTAKKYFLQCIALYEELGNINGQMHTLNNLASAELALGNTDAAFEYAHRTVGMAHSTGERRLESYALLLLGQLHGHCGNYDLAQEYYSRSMAIWRAIGYRLGEVETLVFSGKTLLKMGHYEEACSALLQALSLAGQLQMKTIIFDIHEHLSTVYEHLGDTATALFHHRRFFVLQKEFFGEQVMMRQKSLQVYYEARQAAREAEIYRLKNVELAAANAEILRQKQGLEEYAETIRIAHDQLLDKSIALEHLNRDKDEFIGLAVHGLKNPLSLIIMAASMLRMNSERMVKAELDKNLEWIELSAWRMEDLVLKLLQSNAIESGGMHCAPETIEIAALLSPIVQEYGRLASAKNIRLVAEGSERSAVVFVDASITRDIFDNLVSNAVKFSPPDTTIRVRLLPCPEPDDSTGHEQAGAVHRIAVQDEGPGLTVEDQKRLFGKFERLSAKPTGGEHSTGLGLSIVKRLVEIMGGRIWCESTPGQGATFIVELPAADALQA